MIRWTKEFQRIQEKRKASGPAFQMAGKFENEILILKVCSKSSEMPEKILLGFGGPFEKL
jgi:hypothetical protein